MTYKRPDDQYAIAQAPSMIEDSKRYEKEKEKQRACGASRVMNYKFIMFDGVAHAGVITHICDLDKGHGGKCRCKQPCGAMFFKIG